MHFFWFPRIWPNQFLIPVLGACVVLCFKIRDRFLSYQNIRTKIRPKKVCSVLFQLYKCNRCMASVFPLFLPFSFFKKWPNLHTWKNKTAFCTGARPVADDLPFKSLSAAAARATPNLLLEIFFYFFYKKKKRSKKKKLNIHLGQNRLPKDIKIIELGVYDIVIEDATRCGMGRRMSLPHSITILPLSPIVLKKTKYI
jgi:hypothetical protein